MARRVFWAILLLIPVILGFTVPSLRWMPVLLLAVAAVICVFEITWIQQKKGIRVYKRVAGWGVLALIAEGILTRLEYAVYIFGICVCLAWLVRLKGKVEGAWVDVSATVFTLAYVGLPFAALTTLFLENDQTRAWLLLTLSVVWMTDSFALIIGKKFGSRKLIPRISPGKTIEGSIGGLIGAVFCALGARLFGGETFSQISDLYLIIFCLAFSVIAQLGDLAESLLKRDAGVKDSGSPITGHGGFLDIMDAVLYVTLPLLFFLKIAQPDIWP